MISCSHKSMRLLTLTVLTVLAVTAIGCSSSGSGTGSEQVAGLVADEPLSGAEVTVFGPEDTIPIGSTITGASGQFSFNLPERDHYMLEARGGQFDTGTEFKGTMKGIYLPGEEICSISPLSTLAVDLYKSDTHDFTPEEARREAKRAIGIDPDRTDPFFLEAYSNKTVKNDLDKLTGDTGTLTAELQQVQIDNSGDTGFKYRGELDRVRSQIDVGKKLPQWIESKQEDVPDTMYHNTAGQVHLDTALVEASVGLVKDGKLKQSVTTDKSGRWQSESKQKILGPFRLVAGGGYTETADTSSFNGTLSAYVPYRESWHLDNDTVALDNLNVNILTTVIDRYMQYSDRDYHTALERVKSFFNLPEDVDPTENDTSNYNYSFFPSEFMRRSREHSGFDPYVDSLVKRIDAGASVEMTPPALNAIGGQTGVVSQYLFDGLKEAGTSGAGALASYAATEFVLPALGVKTRDAKIDEMNQQLDEIQNMLDGINNRLASIDNKIDRLGDQMEQQTFELKTTIVDQDLQNHIEDVKDYYGDYNDYVDSGTSIDTEIVAYFMNERMDNHDWKDKFNKLSSAFDLQQFGSAESHFSAATDKWVNQLKNTTGTENKGQKLENIYRLMKLQYDKILSAQWKAAILYMNELHWDVGSGVDFSIEREHFKDRIQKQTRKFLVFVEKIVAGSANVRSELTKGNNMFDREAVKNVFSDADIIARKILSNDTAEFITRVVGPPVNTREYGTPNLSESNTKGVSDSDFGGKTRIKLRENGDGIRGYSAPIPDGYPSSKNYLSFVDNDDHEIHRNIQYAENISFTHFYFDDVNNVLSEYISNGPHEKCTGGYCAKVYSPVSDWVCDCGKFMCEGRSSTCHWVKETCETWIAPTWDLVYSEPAYNAAKVTFDATTDNALTPDKESKNYYGHVTIFSRNLPEFKEYWYNYTNEKSGNDAIYAKGSDRPKGVNTMRHKIKFEHWENLIFDGWTSDADIWSGLTLDLHLKVPSCNSEYCSRQDYVEVQTGYDLGYYGFWYKNDEKFIPECEGLFKSAGKSRTEFSNDGRLTTVNTSDSHTHNLIHRHRHSIQRGDKSAFLELSHLFNVRTKSFCGNNSGDCEFDDRHGWSESFESRWDFSYNYLELLPTN